jgi:hypothetical protein
MSIFIEPMRQAVSGAFPVLIGALTLAVGGFAAFTLLKRSQPSPLG